MHAEDEHLLHMSTYLHVHVHARICMYVYVSAHMYMHMYMHKSTYMHVGRCLFVRVHGYERFSNKHPYVRERDHACCLCF